MKRLFKLKIFVLTFALVAQSSPARAAAIKSAKIQVDAARIAERIVLVDDQAKSLKVQVIQEFLHGATDVSNTSRLVLSISRLGEETGATASFVIGNSMSLKSAKRVSGGIYKVTFDDADALGTSSTLEVTKTIDARKAVIDVEHAKVEEFGSAVIGTVIELN